MAVRERRESLSRERILAAAVDVADAEGVDAVTMRRLAEALQVHPTSLYNHLPSKEAILDGLADWVIVEAALPPRFDTWQEWIRVFADGLRRVARAHPGAFMVLTQRAATGPGSMAQTEGALDAFMRTGWSAPAAAEAITGTSLALLGIALNECPPTAPFTAPDFSHLSPDAFPRIREAAAAELDEDGIWTRMVEAIIAGLAVSLATS
jgi:AcrR family transcriptional regulator